MIHYHHCALNSRPQQPRKDLAVGTDDTADAVETDESTTEYTIARAAAETELAESEARLAAALEALEGDGDLAESGLDLDRLRRQD